MRRVGRPTRRGRGWRIATLGAAALGCALGVAWSAPRVSEAVGAWLAAPPVRAATLVLVPASTASVRSAAGGSTAGGEVPLVVAAAGPGGAGATEAARRTSQVSALSVDPGLRFNMVGFSCPPGKAGEAVVRFRTCGDDGAWSRWRRLGFQAVRGDDGVTRLVTEPQWVGSARYLEVRGRGWDSVKGAVRLTCINTLGDATAADRVANALRRAALAVAGFAAGDAASAATERPPIVTRAQWGADESWRRGDPEYGVVRFAVVHHTASGNDYTREQAPGVVRAVYFYHAKVCRFYDIGYNFLIDRYGTIYEGRKGGVTKAVRGAQALGFNSSSTGISVIGDFSAGPPPTAAVAALERLLAWKLDVHHVDPLSWVAAYCSDTDKFKGGTTVKVRAISAHRDVCNTDCPGDAFAKLLPAVRRVVADTGLPKLYAFNASPAVISPNADGMDDVSVIEAIASGPVAWTVTVAAEDGAVVRSFSGDGQQIAATWDGTDESGSPVPDGRYIVTGKAVDGQGAVARECQATVAVDTSAPQLTIDRVTPSLLNPSGGAIGTVGTLTYSIDEPCVVKAVVRDGSGRSIDVLQAWTALAAGSNTVRWDGRTASGTRRVIVEDGRYRLEVTARDTAGNVVARSGALRVDRTIRVTNKLLAASPNGDGTADAVGLTFRLTRPAAVELVLSRADATVLTRSWPVLEAGTHSFDWDGLWPDGKVRGGRYRVSLAAASQGRQVPAAVDVVIDTRRPRVRLVPTASKVRRSGAAVVTCRVVDNLGPTASVTIVVRDPAGRIVRRSTKIGVVTNADWRFGVRPERRGRYRVSFTATDAAGNRQSGATVWSVRSL